MANGHGGWRPNAGRKGAKGSGGAKKATVPATIASPPAKGGISIEAIQGLIEASQRRARSRENAPEFNPFRLPQFPPGAVPKKIAHRLTATMAMDENINWATVEWSSGLLGGLPAEGLLFLGYPYLSELAQRPEYRVISETIATEMTRKWIKFKSTSDADKTQKIKELNDYLSDLKVQDHFADLAINDGLFGRTHLFLDSGDDKDIELKTPIGNGRDALTKAKVGKGWLKRLQVVEPTWCYPTTYNAQNPLAIDWYNPQVWYVMGREIHVSRIPTFVGRPVPDLLKPAYSFGGLALSQMAKPYVDIWLQTRQSVGELIHAFSVMVLSTDLNTILAPNNASGLLARAAMFNALRDNQGLFIVNKTTEDFKNVSAPISGLHELQAQAQEHMMSVSRIPAVKFTGNQPSGLNASSEGEIRAFYDTIAAYQNKFFRPHLTELIDIAMISLWGTRDPEIVYDFEPLWELSEKEKSEKRKTDAETGKTYIDSGVVAPEEERRRIASDPNSGYDGIDPDDVPDLAEEEEEGLMPGGKEPSGFGDERTL